MEAHISMKKSKAFWLDLGRMPYTPAFDIQTDLYAGRIDGQVPTIVIVQENDPVFTIGRTGSRSNILIQQEKLEALGIQIVEVNRGGDVTYHAPGQIIVSPLFYLGDINQNANQYFHRLEDLLISVLARFEITSGKKEGYPGAWCGEEKIGALGIAVRHGYTCHGFSLNVNPDLFPFGLINPCGVQRMPVTSMEKILGCKVPGQMVRDIIKDEMKIMFGFEFQDITLKDAQRMLQKPPVTRTAES